MNYDGITDYSVCSCGAVTLFHCGGATYSCDMKNRQRFLPGLDLRKVRKMQKTYCCDYCVNHYGLDLCACGSGEKFWKCRNGFEECGHPMQAFGEYSRVVSAGSWIA